MHEADLHEADDQISDEFDIWTIKVQSTFHKKTVCDLMSSLMASVLIRFRLTHKG